VTGRWMRRCVVALALAAMGPAAAVPCAARGTGGFLRDWIVCGPLAETRLDAPALPEDFIAYPGLVAAGGAWLPIEAEPRGRVDLRSRFPDAETGTALLFTFLKTPKDGTYRLRIGSDDAVRVEVDGRTIHRRDVRRSWSADQDTVAVRLSAGWHRLLVRVVEYGGDWGASVRVADADNRPLDLPHQATCPNPLRAACRLTDPASVSERAEVATFLSDQVARLQADLESAVPPLVETPDGYVAFAEYQSARALGRRFFEALATLWAEAVREHPNAERVRAAHHQAEDAARGFSEVLARQTDSLAADLMLRHDVWRRMSDEALSRGDLAQVTLHVADLVGRTRSLTGRLESERLLAARFENDIRNFRQRDVAVIVRDADGRPVPGADVTIVQQAHDFAFGCNLFAFGRWGKKNDVYTQRFAHLFNLAVVPVYWSVVERQKGRPAYGRVDDAVRWCRSQGIRVRAHPLVWADAVPRWIEPLDADAARQALRAHVQRTVRRYRQTVDWWDVAYNPNGVVPVGSATVPTAEVMAWAAGARPAGGLVLSADDPATLAPAVRQAEDGDPRVAAVGATAHQHDGVWSMETIRRTVRQAASAGRPVHLAAVTILGGPGSEAEQAEAVRHFYTAAFATRQVAGITWWDLSDRFAWRNSPAGLLRADLSPKPAYHALADLVHRRWWTDAAGQTNAAGRTHARVFYGTYRITARAGGREATLEVALARGEAAPVEIVLPPGR